MKSLALFASTLGFASMASAALYEGNLVANPGFSSGDKEDYSGWTVQDPWRTNHVHKNLVFAFTLPDEGTKYKGFRAAAAQSLDLRQLKALQADASHDPSSTQLRGLDFGSVTLKVAEWTQAHLGDKLKAKLFAMVDVKATSGHFRMQSKEIEISRKAVLEDGTLASGKRPLHFNWWADYGKFKGDPFNGGNGIALDQIQSITLNWMIKTDQENAFSENQPNKKTQGAFWLQVDDAELTYQVRTPKNNLELSNLFADQMVLQRGKPMPVFGTADAGSKVSVKLSSGESAEAITDNNGQWKVTLAELKLGDPISLSAAIVGQTPVTLENILVGDVWVCSGQSNMEWNLKSSENWQTAASSAKNPKLRLFEVPNQPADSPQLNLSKRANWELTTPTNAPGFSAVAYYFGKKIQQETGVPVGLLDVNWGGTRIEPWTPSETQGYTHNQAHQKSSVLYNNMIHPQTQLPIKGILWYQGESNLGDGAAYAGKLEKMVKEWRQAWGQSEAPFYFVQLAPFIYQHDKSQQMLPKFWVGQAQAAESIPHAGMAVINDVGDNKDIHPRDKATVGDRLARLALNKTYGQSAVVCSGPVARSATRQGKRLLVEFDHAGGGLTTRNDLPLTSFEIAAADGQFYQAFGKIQGSSVVLSSPKVSEPHAVRFAWKNTACPVLVNQASLPTSTFSLEVE